MLPQWLDPESWAGFVEMRKAIPRCPFTPRAQMLILKELQSLKDQGYDPNKCLDQSTMKGWRGVFPVKSEGKPKSTYEESQARMKEWDEQAKQARSPESIRARELALSKLKVVR